jgi:CheY-like chemotaxis protein
MNVATVRALIVDDDPAMLTLIQRILEAEFSDSLSIELCADPKTAITNCEANRIDILITDLDMPELNGFSLLKQIKTINPLIQVVMLSAQPSQNALLSAFAMGADEYLTKPIDRPVLIETTQFLINRILRYRNQFLPDSFFPMQSNSF